MIKNYGTWLKESAATAMSLTDEEVEELAPELHEEIEDHLNEEIIGWESGLENASEEAEAEAVQSFGENGRFLAFWKVYSDGTLEVILINGYTSLDYKEKRNSFEDFDIEWKDEDGEEQTTNFLNALDGTVKVDFEKGATSGENQLPKELAERVKQFFQKKRGHLKGKKFGL